MGSLSSMVGCQPWALEVAGSNPADPIFVKGMDRLYIFHPFYRMGGDRH